MQKKKITFKEAVSKDWKEVYRVWKKAAKESGGNFMLVWKICFYAFITYGLYKVYLWSAEFSQLWK